MGAGSSVAGSAQEDLNNAFYIQHNESHIKQTKVYFDATSEEIVIDRSTSNSDDKVIKDVLRGSLNMFRICGVSRERIGKLAFWIC